MDERKLTVEIDLQNGAALRSARELADAQRRMVGEMLADAQRAEKGQTEAARAGNRERTGDTRGRFAAHRDAAREAFQEEAKGWKGSASGAASAASAVAGFAAQMVGLSSVTAIAATIASGFREAQKSAFDAAKMVGDYRQELLELSALKGRLGDTTSALREEIVFRARTLQTPEAARKFQETAIGVGESVISTPGQRRLIERADFEKAMALAGRFQATEGGDPTAHGTLLGLTPSLMGREHVTAEDVFRREQQYYKIMQPGGFTFGSGAQQFSKLAPLITSGVYKDTEALALLSAFSTTNREGAGENVEQFTRATLGGIGRMRGAAIEGSEKQGEYLKKLGITDQFTRRTKATDLPFRIGDLIAKDLEAQEQRAKAAGEAFNAYTYLKHKGFGNEQDVAALLQYKGLIKTGQLRQTFLPLAAPAAEPTMAQAQGALDEAERRAPALQRRKGELAGEAANIAVGAGREEYLQNLYRLSFARLKSVGEVSGEYSEDIQDRWDIDPREVLFGYRHKLDMEAQRMLVEEARRVGVKAEIPYTVEPRSGERIEKFMGRERLFELGRKVTGAGGRPVPGMEDVIGRAERQLGAAARFEEGRPALPPAPARPPGPDARELPPPPRPAPPAVALPPVVVPEAPEAPPIALPPRPEPPPVRDLPAPPRPEKVALSFVGFDDWKHDREHRDRLPVVRSDAVLDRPLGSYAPSDREAAADAPGAAALGKLGLRPDALKGWGPPLSRPKPGDLFASAAEDFDFARAPIPPGPVPEGLPAPPRPEPPTGDWEAIGEKATPRPSLLERQHAARFAAHPELKGLPPAALYGKTAGLIPVGEDASDSAGAAMAPILAIARQRSEQMKAEAAARTLGVRGRVRATDDIGALSARVGAREGEAEPAPGGAWEAVAERPTVPPVLSSPLRPVRAPDSLDTAWSGGKGEGDKAGERQVERLDKLIERVERVGTAVGALARALTERRGADPAPRVPAGAPLVARR